MSDLNAALAFVDDFDANASTNVSWKLDRYWTLQRIRALLRHPEELNQRGLNACAPAIFFRIWFARDPVSAAKFSCSLLRDGSASIGSLFIAPSWKLRDQNYAMLKSTTDAAHYGATPENADWMLLSALRDSENIYFDYVGEPYTLQEMAAGVTLPSTLCGWLNATNLYSSVANETNILTASSQQRLLSMIPTSNVDIVLMVSSSFNANMYPSIPTDQQPGVGGVHIPDHYVLQTAPFAQWNDPAWLNIECWSWGRTLTGWVGYDQFFTKYFGLILATA
jgi:hypothetical protein